tara:strand:+ start:630 stop:803 length:174 start_codon:yes stop_codon:yes gene_type:complete
MTNKENKDSNKPSKLEGIVSKPSDSEDEIFEKLMTMFEIQGIEVKKINSDVLISSFN